MYGLLYECKFLTIEETKKNQFNISKHSEKKLRKHQRCNSQVASQNHLVKLDSCFQDLSMFCAKYQSSGIAGSQEEDF
jgi:hypothetical protein